MQRTCGVITWRKGRFWRNPVCPLKMSTVLWNPSNITYLQTLPHPSPSLWEYFFLQPQVQPFQTNDDILYGVPQGSVQGRLWVLL